VADLADVLRVAVTGRARASSQARAEPVSSAVAVSGSSVVEGVVTSSRDAASDEIGWRLRGAAAVGNGAVQVTQESALRSSAVWACLRLRGNLVSSLPVDTFRPVGGVQVEVPRPVVLEEPMPGVDWTEHAYSSEVDLARHGNSVGIIRAFSALGLPLMVELAPMSALSAVVRGTQIVEYTICGERYLPSQILHERQYTVGGWPIGLSPVAYGAWSIGGYLSAQQFVTDWFMGGAAPSGVLRNTQLDELDANVIQTAKDRFKLAVAGRDVFVTGADWEWIPAAMDAASAGFLEERQYGLSDIARFLDVPGDMIDAPSSGSSVTYANITQRNVQTLVMNIGPGLRRRERFWSRRALPQPRQMKFNTDAFLRMDPQTRTALLLSQVAGKTLAPSEARALDNRAPFTPEQMDELRTFGIIGGTTTPAVAPAGIGAA
jgi:HK97 family phage portal protein